jgi:hypothetical protein
MPEERTTTRYSMTMKNRPGEFMKLTKRLTDAGVKVNGLRIANLGETASIQFSTESDRVLPAGLRKAQIE